MNKPAEARDEAALEIRFGPLDLTQVRVRTTDPGAILDNLTGRVATAPRFFERTAVCLDLSLLATEPDAAEVRAVIDGVRRAGMLPIGLTDGPAFVDKVARALELPVLAQFRVPNKSPPVIQPAEPIAALPPAQQDSAQTDTPALLHSQHVRSGQRIYARHCDLIVTATVGAGAEVMADGCVHIYGELRGRAMAGTHGDVAARVFCQAFRAELVSIAGVFRVFESIPEELAGQPVQAWLAGDDLHFARISP